MSQLNMGGHVWKVSITEINGTGVYYLFCSLDELSHACIFKTACLHPHRELNVETEMFTHTHTHSRLLVSLFEQTHTAKLFPCSIWGQYCNFIPLHLSSCFYGNAPCLHLLNILIPSSSSGIWISKWFMWECVKKTQSQSRGAFSSCSGAFDHIPWSRWSSASCRGVVDVQISIFFWEFLGLLIQSWPCGEIIFSTAASNIKKES